ncbi:MAG: hypothetical protein JXB62_07590 [Pirellulales bacterium]|nr:hypothetical protein [Pirellulales bacterium]
MCLSAIRMRRGPLQWLLVLGLLAVSAGTAQAETPQIVRVEEDWELVVNTPEPQSFAPQVSCVMSPRGDIDGLHAALELNVQSLLTFLAGGVQLQLWHGETPLNDRKFPSDSVMSQPGETVTWTQTMQVANGVITFEVINGSSQTWGNFGGQGYLKVFLNTDLSNLNGYDPAVSVANSGINYAANRVDSLILKKIRVYDSNGNVVEHSTPIVVHPPQQ